MLKSRGFLGKLTQSVRKICIFFFEFEEEKNLLTASKAPQCYVRTDLQKHLTTLLVSGYHEVIVHYNRGQPLGNATYKQFSEWMSMIYRQHLVCILELHLGQWHIWTRLIEGARRPVNAVDCTLHCSECSVLTSNYQTQYCKVVKFEWMINNNCFELILTLGSIEFMYCKW